MGTVIAQYTLDARLLMCCVDSINEIENGPVPRGPTPGRIRDNSRFRSLAAVLRELQLLGPLDFIVVQEGNESVAVPMLDWPDGTGPHTELLFRICKIHELDDGIETLRLASRSRQRAWDEIAMTGRSLLATLFFQSHSVDPPQVHSTRFAAISSTSTCSS